MGRFLGRFLVGYVREKLSKIKTVHRRCVSLAPQNSSPKILLKRAEVQPFFCSISDFLNPKFPQNFLNFPKFPMSDPLSPAISDRICKHMNEDHADAVLLYARVYGGAEAATAAKMVSIDPEGMTLEVEQEGIATPVRVTFDHRLKDSEDAHQTLIAMVRKGRSQA